MRLRNSAILLAAAGLGLGGCATYGPYGGSGVSVGYGSGYGGYGAYGSPYGYGGYDDYGYGSPYGYAGYSPYGSRYGYNPYNSYYGWNGGYYYPGTGYYVYDRDRKPRVWTTAERLYWLKRRAETGSTQSVRNQTVRTRSGSTAVAVPTSPNWGGFDRREVRQQNRATRIEQRQERRATRSVQVPVTTTSDDRASSRSSGIREMIIQRRAQRAERRRGD